GGLQQGRGPVPPAPLRRGRAVLPPLPGRRRGPDAAPAPRPVRPGHQPAVRGRRQGRPLAGAGRAPPASPPPPDTRPPPARPGARQTAEPAGGTRRGPNGEAARGRRARAGPDPSTPGPRRRTEDEPQGKRPEDQNPGQQGEQALQQGGPDKRGQALLHDPSKG